MVSKRKHQEGLEKECPRPMKKVQVTVESESEELESDDKELCMALQDGSG